MKTVRIVRAEELGLVTIIANAALVKKKPAGGAVRVRLNPPKELQRDDGQVLDLEAALAFAQKYVIARLSKIATWTDTVTGAGRLTISFAAKNPTSVLTAAATLDVDPYDFEDVEQHPSAKARLTPLLSEVGLYEIKKGPSDAAITKALKGKKSPGSFTKKAGLDSAKLDPKKVLGALAWLDKELAKLGVDALGVYVNAHPQQRRFDFELHDEDHGAIGTKVQTLLAAHFGFDLEAARRIPGALWKANKLSGKGLKHVEIDASN